MHIILYRFNLPGSSKNCIKVLTYNFFNILTVCFKRTYTAAPPPPKLRLTFNALQGPVQCLEEEDDEGHLNWQLLHNVPLNSTIDVLDVFF